MDMGTQHASFKFLYAMLNCYFWLFSNKAQLLFIIDFLWFLLFFVKLQEGSKVQKAESLHAILLDFHIEWCSRFDDSVSWSSNI